MIAPSVFTRVTVEYTLGRTAVDPRVWTCVGSSTDSSVILSSCRDVRISSPAGVVEARPDIFYENGRREVASTRYMLAKLAFEHLWQWADMR